MTQPSNQTETLVNQQLSHLTALEDLLADEFGAIRSRDLTALQDANTQKQQLLGQIHHVDQAMASYAEAISEEQRNAIRQMLHKCKRQNLINGRAINMAQTAGQRLRLALMGTESETVQTYNAKGSATAIATSHRFCEV